MNSSIKKWAKDDRPREKLLSKGKSVLTDAELLSIIIGSGTRTKSAVDLAREIMGFVGQDLNRLSQLGIGELCKFKGIGMVKSVNIIASIELGRRRESNPTEAISRIKSSADVNKLMKAEFKDMEFEVFWILCLNRANKIVAKAKISEGGG